MQYWNKEKVSGPSISLANAYFTMKTVINIGGKKKSYLLFILMWIDVPFP